MSEEGPRLFSHKPKKAQLKKVIHDLKPNSNSFSSPSSAAAASYTMGAPPPPPPPPPQPPKESFARRYKFLWPLLLTVNIAVGAYLFMRTKKPESSITEEEEDKVAKDVPSPTTTATTAAAVIEQPRAQPAATPIAEIVKPREPIPQDQQRELFKWILEEKRKIKPKDKEEKKRVDEEKAVLKHFIRAKSLPSI